MLIDVIHILKKSNQRRQWWSFKKWHVPLIFFRLQSATMLRMPFNDRVQWDGQSKTVQLWRTTLHESYDRSGIQGFQFGLQDISKGVCYHGPVHKHEEKRLLQRMHRRRQVSYELLWRRAVQRGFQFCGQRFHFVGMRSIYSVSSAIEQEENLGRRSFA